MFDFSGKSSRSEFWWGVFGNVVIMLILFALLIISLTCKKPILNSYATVMIVILCLFCVVELVPSVSLIFRRMHDIGLGGIYILTLFLPVAGWIWYLYLVTRPSNFFSGR